jgi:hypothetical protein
MPNSFRMPTQPSMESHHVGAMFAPRPETVASELRASQFHQIKTELIAIDFDFPMNSAGIVNFFRKYFAPTRRLSRAKPPSLADGSAGSRNSITRKLGIQLFPLSPKQSVVWGNVPRP